MGTEGYRPTEEEMTRAKDSMSDEQKANSETRESILIDSETKERFAKYIETVRNGEKLPPDFSRGPQSSYGIYSEPFEGYNVFRDVTESDLPKWKELVSQDAFDEIESIFESNIDRIKADKEDWVEKNHAEPEEGSFDHSNVRISWAGSTLQAPSQTEGYGGYHYWKEYDNCWMEVGENMYEYDDTPFMTKGVEHHYNISVALKMTNEQKEEYVQYLLDTYGISEDQIKN